MRSTFWLFLLPKNAVVCQFESTTNAKRRDNFSRIGYQVAYFRSIGSVMDQQVGLNKAMRFQPAGLRLDLDRSPSGSDATAGRDACGGGHTAVLATIWENSRDRYIEHHPDWAKLAAQREGLELRAFTTARDARVDSYALIEEGRGALVWLLGEVTIYKKPVQRLRVVGGQSFALDLGPAERRERAHELLAWLALEAQGRPIFLQSLPIDSPLWEIVNSKQQRFRVIWHSPPKPHFFIDLPDSVEAFYNRLGYKTRKSIRYSIRKLEREMSGRVLLKRFSKIAEIDEFIDIAIKISNKTYQYKLLGMGIRDRHGAKLLFTKTAEHGWWRGYILYCKDEAVAFIYGYRVGAVFYYWDVGYDPNWTKWSVGTIAAVKLVETLITDDDRVLRLDFLYGDNDYKRRLSNAQCEEQNFYLFPRDWRSLFVSYSLHVTNLLSYRTGRILDRYKLKWRLKRLLRREAIQV